MRTRLIRDGINLYATLHDLRQQFGAVAHQANRHRPFLFARVFANVQRFIQRLRDPIAVTCLDAPLDPRRIDFNSEKDRAIQSRRERLRAAHPAESA